jgi:hypothetical protein
MTTDYAVTHGRYDEIVVAGKPLGRHKMTDSRSAAYPFRPARRVAVADKDWLRHIPILDQGDVGSCEGDAEVGCAGTSPVWDGLPAGHPAMDQAEAYRLYALATTLDGFPGTFTYPPPGGQDTGTDSTSANKAAKQLGLISGYTHTGTVDGVLQALMTGPCNLGIDWYESFDDPAADGLVSIARSAAIRGGHALCARGVDAERQRVWLDNSWSLSWGFAGRFCFTWDTLDELLSTGGECVVPVPLTVAPPVPVPVPADPFAAFWNGGPGQQIPGGMRAWCAQTRTRPDLVQVKADALACARLLGQP